MAGASSCMMDMPQLISEAPVTETPMEDQKPRQGNILSTCQVCSECLARYRCPGCSIQTCSLTCVKLHKQKKQCTGVRDKVAFLPVAAFKDINVLSDYRFLEDTARTADNAGRDIKWKQKRKPQFLHKLEQKAKGLGINLKLMPYPMTKRKTNRTRIYKMNSKDATIDWQVEWIFPQTDVTFKQLVPFLQPLQEVLQKHLHPTQSDPVRRHSLRRYVTAGLDNVHLYMKAEGIPANQTRYHMCDVNKTMTENLVGKVVVEYPTVYVVLKDYVDSYRSKVLGGEETNSEEEETSEESSSDDESSSSEEEVDNQGKGESVINDKTDSNQVVNTYGEVNFNL